MIYRRLLELQEKGQLIQVGLIAAGTFGTQIVSQVCQMPGVRIAAVAELDLSRGIRAYRQGGLSEETVTTVEEPRQLNQAIHDGRPAVTSDAQVLFESEIDVVVEATGNVQAGARHAQQAIGHKKHVAMVTVEADVVVGARLRELADRAGVLYSAAYGDEPALALELWDWASSLGFRVVAAGKGTRFKKSFRKANPDDVARLYGFTGKDYNAQMFGSFLDGTKHSIEMCALSNMSGLVPDIRGMHFPNLDLREIPEKLCRKDKGGILNQEGVVEVVSSIDDDDRAVERHLRGGLYAVIDGPVPALVESMKSYGEICGMITGERSHCALVYRPQHFIGHEMPITLARMMLDGQTCGTPVGQISDVVAAAKKPLQPGTVLDGEGGYTVYGLLEKADLAREESLVPMGLTEGARVVREIPEDGMITYDNVEIPESAALRLRQAQEAALSTA